MPKFLNGQCHECGGQLEFPAEAVGTTADCPHCGKPTELRLAAPRSERTIPLKTIVYTCITILILVGGLVAVLIVLKWAEGMVGRNSAAPTRVAPQSPAGAPPSHK